MDCKSICQAYLKIRFPDMDHLLNISKRLPLVNISTFLTSLMTAVAIRAEIVYSCPIMFGIKCEKYYPSKNVLQFLALDSKMAQAGQLSWFLNKGNDPNFLSKQFSLYDDYWIDKNFLFCGGSKGELALCVNKKCIATYSVSGLWYRGWGFECSEKVMIGVFQADMVEEIVFNWLRLDKPVHWIPRPF